MTTAEVFLVLCLALQAATATAVVLVRRLRVQAVVLSAYGLVQTLSFTALQAPDLAIAQLAVGSAAVPILFVLVINRLKSPRKA